VKVKNIAKKNFLYIFMPFYSPRMTNPDIHPRRLFPMPPSPPPSAVCDETNKSSLKVDERNCLKPSTIAKTQNIKSTNLMADSPPNRRLPLTPLATGTGGLPLLAPSPSSCVYIEVSQLVNDVENLIEFIQSLGDNFSDGFLSSSSPKSVPDVVTKQIAPLREAIQALSTRIYEQSTMAIITPLLTPKDKEETRPVVDRMGAVPAIPTREMESPQNKEQPNNDESTDQLVASPPRGVCDSSLQTSQTMSMQSLGTASSTTLSIDVDHLRKIQQQVRGLFSEAPPKGVDSPSPIRRGLHGRISDQPLVTRSDAGSTATKISTLLRDEEVLSPVGKRSIRMSTGEGGLSQLTLSPGTELFDRDSIRTNPWFKKGGVVAPKVGKIQGRVIPNENEQRTVNALSAVMARQRAGRVSTAPPRTPQPSPKSDLISWLKKQAVHGSPGYNGGSAKDIASIYTHRHASGTYGN